MNSYHPFVTTSDSLLVRVLSHPAVNWLSRHFVRIEHCRVGNAHPMTYVRIDLL